MSFSATFFKAHQLSLAREAKGLDRQCCPMLRQSPDITAQVAHMSVKEEMSHGVLCTVSIFTG